MSPQVLSPVYRTVEMYAHVKETLIWPSKWWGVLLLYICILPALFLNMAKGLLKPSIKLTHRGPFVVLTTFFDWQPRVWADLAFFESL